MSWPVSIRSTIVLGLTVAVFGTVIPMRRNGASEGATTEATPPSGTTANSEQPRIGMPLNPVVAAAATVEASKPESSSEVGRGILGSQEQVEAHEIDVDKLEPGQIQELLSGLVGAATDVQRQLRIQLIERWAGQSPSQAAAWARSHLSGSDLEEAEILVATRWFESDTVGATTFVKSMEDSSLRNTALLALGYEALREEPRRAVELVQEVPPSDSRNDFLVQAVQEWSAQEFEAVQSWVERFDEPELKDRLRAAVAIGIAEADGRAAAVYAATAMQPGENQDRAVVSVLQRWIQSHPQEAVTWLEQFPEGELQRVATQNLVSVWLQQDPEKANQWLERLPAGSLRLWAHAAKPIQGDISAP